MRLEPNYYNKPQSRLGFSALKIDFDSLTKYANTANIKNITRSLPEINVLAKDTDVFIKGFKDEVGPFNYEECSGIRVEVAPLNSDKYVVEAISNKSDYYSPDSDNLVEIIKHMRKSINKPLKASEEKEKNIAIEALRKAYELLKQ